MSTEALADALSSLALTQTELHTESTQDCVPFRPSEKFAWLQLSDSPRYLFRVYTRYTDGHTDASCVKSKDACKNEPNAAQDIIDREDVEEAAAMLDRHLRWKGSYKDSDNLMSWTSSLLFALRYVFFRHHHNSCPLEEIMLCVIDTTKLVANTFIRDMDLMHAFEDFCPELKDFKDGLRTKKSKFHSGHWYFGEYLSQGSLKIEGKSCTVSAKAVVDAGLFLLQPGFKVAMEIRSQRWANDVIELREPFYSSSTTSSQQQELSWEQVVAAIEIGKLFGEPWTLPMAANFFSLLPRKENDAILIAAFRDGYLLVSVSNLSSMSCANACRF